MLTWTTRLKIKCFDGMNIFKNVHDKIYKQLQDYQYSAEFTKHLNPQKDKLQRQKRNKMLWAQILSPTFKN